MDEKGRLSGSALRAVKRREGRADGMRRWLSGRFGARPVATATAPANGGGPSGRFRARRTALLVAAMLWAGVALAAGCGAVRNAAERPAAGAAPSRTADGAAGVAFADAAGKGGAADTGDNLRADGNGSAVSVSAGFSPDGSSSSAAGVSIVTAEPTGQRKIIYSADVDMAVEDFDRARDELEGLVARSGGYLLHFSDSRNVREIGGNFTIKVPADGFRPFLAELEKLKKGREFRRSVRGEDVTEEYVDLSARLRAKEAVEARLLELMKQAAEAKDLLEFSNALARVQEDIEALKGKIRYINENAAYSTVELYMYQVIEDGIRRPGDDALLSRIGSAFVDGAQGVIRFLGDCLVFLAGALPVLVLVAAAAAPGAWIARNALKKRRVRRQAGENPPET